MEIKDLDKTALEPVRRTEAGKYEGLERPVDKLAGPGSVADKLKKRRQEQDSGKYLDKHGY